MRAQRLRLFAPPVHFHPRAQFLGAEELFQRSRSVTLLIRDLGCRLASPHATLSEREFQVFCKIAVGKPVSKIADELFLSVKTVSTYRARILQKMNMKNNADLTYYAVKNQLIR